MLPLGWEVWLWAELDQAVQKGQVGPLHPYVQEIQHHWSLDPGVELDFDQCIVSHQM